MDELELRREQLDRYFNMLLSWAQQSGVPILQAQSVQSFMVQEGDLPAPDLPPNRAGRLKLANLLNASAAASSQAGGNAGDGVGS